MQGAWVRSLVWELWLPESQIGFSFLLPFITQEWYKDFRVNPDKNFLVINSGYYSCLQPVGRGVGPGGSDSPPSCSIKHVGFGLPCLFCLNAPLLCSWCSVFADEIFTLKQEAIPLSLLKAVNRLWILSLPNSLFAYFFSFLEGLFIGTTHPHTLTGLFRCKEGPTLPPGPCTVLGLTDVL